MFAKRSSPPPSKPCCLTFNSFQPLRSVPLGEGTMTERPRERRAGTRDEWAAVSGSASARRDERRRWPPTFRWSRDSTTERERAPRCRSRRSASNRREPAAHADSTAERGRVCPRSPALPITTAKNSEGAPASWRCDSDLLTMPAPTNILRPPRSISARSRLRRIRPSAACRRRLV